MSERAPRKDVVASAALDDPTIPVLTERLTLPELDLDFTLPPAPQPQPAAHTPAAGGGEEPVATPEPFSAVFEVPAPSEPRVPVVSGAPSSSTSPVAQVEQDAETPRPAAPSARHAAVLPPEKPKQRAHDADVSTAPLPSRTTVVTASVDGGGLPAADALASAAAQGDPARMDRAQIELREAILTELAQRLPQDVETIVRAQMAGAIDAAVNRLAQEARFALASSLREIVDRAVRAELDRLRTIMQRR